RPGAALRLRNRARWRRRIPLSAPRGRVRFGRGTGSGDPPNPALDRRLPRGRRQPGFSTARPSAPARKIGDVMNPRLLPALALLALLPLAARPAHAQKALDRLQRSA